MNEHDTATGKIEVHAVGIGTVTSEMVERRAEELAKMDGRRSINENDLDQAYAEMVGNLEQGAPEAGGGLERLVEWDRPIDGDGLQATDIFPDDENSLAESLVQEGLEEAEHEHRLAAADQLASSEDE